MHTPYDGSSKLFEIGLKPLDPADWLDVDGERDTYLALKAQLGAERFDGVFVAEAGTEVAQQEVLALVTAHLAAHFPDLDRTPRNGPALWAAACLVQDDLVLMRKGETGWRVAAGAVCFPSSWRLGEKAGRTMDEVHQPVPGFGAGTRPAELINRMFDHLRPGMPVIRWNWSIYGDAELFHPEDSPPRRFGPGARADSVFLRAERQTLRKLPVSGDILFAIRIYVDPIAALERHERAAAIAGQLIGQVAALNAEQLAYKGLTLERERLIARLEEIAGR